MATEQRTADFLTEQIAGAGEARNRKMFGEYALYLDDKVIALICDEQLFIKPTDPGRQFIGSPELGPPYPGAKDYFRIPEDHWDDAGWLSGLARLTADALPMPKPKRPRTK
jgi:DNA transformation protein and related proteins